VRGWGILRSFRVNKYSNFYFCDLYLLIEKGIWMWFCSFSDVSSSGRVTRCCKIICDWGGKMRKR